MILSRVYLIAADKPLPLCSCQEKQTRMMKFSEHVQNSALRGKEYPISSVCAFQVLEHTYYRGAVDELGYPMKSYQYELDLQENEWSLEKLTAYLRENLSPGEHVELWSLWVGSDAVRPVRYQGRLDDFELDTLQQFLRAESICMTITI